MQCPPVVTTPALASSWDLLPNLCVDRVGLHQCPSPDKIILCSQSTIIWHIELTVEIISYILWRNEKTKWSDAVAKLEPYGVLEFVTIPLAMSLWTIKGQVDSFEERNSVLLNTMYEGSDLKRDQRIKTPLCWLSHCPSLMCFSYLKTSLYVSPHVEQRVMLTPSPIQHAGNSSSVKTQWKAWSLVCASP